MALRVLYCQILILKRMFSEWVPKFTNFKLVAWRCKDAVQIYENLLKQGQQFERMLLRPKTFLSSSHSELHKEAKGMYNVTEIQKHH